MSIYNFQCKEFDFENSKYLLENQNVCFSKTTNHAQASGFKKKYNNIYLSTVIILLQANIQLFLIQNLPNSFH